MTMSSDEEEERTIPLDPPTAEEVDALYGRIRDLEYAIIQCNKKLKKRQNKIRDLEDTVLFLEDTISKQDAKIKRQASVGGGSESGSSMELGRDLTVPWQISI